MIPLKYTNLIIFIMNRKYYYSILHWITCSNNYSIVYDYCIIIQFCMYSMRESTGKGKMLHINCYSMSLLTKLMSGIRDQGSYYSDSYY